MPPQRARSQARLLAPAALVVSALAVAVIVLTSGGDDDGAPKDVGTARSGAATTSAGRAGRRAPRSTYTVKSNDSLGTIAEKTGVEVERLQELNPQLDPQAINPGQKIKLRE